MINARQMIIQQIARNVFESEYSPAKSGQSFASWFQPGMSARSFAGAARLDRRASPPGLHFQDSVNAGASLPSINSTTCFPIFGSSLKEWLVKLHKYKCDSEIESLMLAVQTYPLSPVASIKFFQRGCSQINKLASAVSVHQHIVRLRRSLSANCGINLVTALRIVPSEASGYVS